MITIEVGKDYIIAIKDRCELARDLATTYDELIDPGHIRGKVTLIHIYGFLFKLEGEKFSRAGDVNVIWDTVKWIHTVEE